MRTTRALRTLQTLQTLRNWLASAAMGLLGIIGCGGDDGGRTSATGVASTITATGSGTSAGDDGLADETVGGPQPDAGSGADGVGTGDACVPADVLVVLDRSQSMHREPAGDTPANDMAGYEASRWWIALETLQAFVVEFESGLNIGLDLFPAPSGDCVTLPQRIGGTSASGDNCGTSEPLITPAPDTAMAFAGALDPLTTLLCNQTPISTAIDDAGPVLAPLATGDHEQFVILVTDGGESCDGDFTGSVQGLVRDVGAKVYVVAFGDTAMTTAHDGLNRMACAGQTAVDFPNPCTDDGMGNWDATDPAGPALYIAAEDGQALADAFFDIAVQLCCGGSCPPG
jgi:hypothetical protein